SIRGDRPDAISSSILLRFREGQGRPYGTDRVVEMIDPLGRLDTVQELLVANGVDQLAERRGDGHRTGRVGTGPARLPRLDPGAYGDGPFGLGQEFADPQAVEHGVAEVRVGEVHDGRHPAVTAPVPGVE